MAIGPSYVSVLRDPYIDSAPGLHCLGDFWGRRHPQPHGAHRHPYPLSCVGLLVEVFPLACPLTLAENWLELRVGTAPYQGGFLLHYLDLLVYPNMPPILLTEAAVLAVMVNVVVYGRRW